MRRKQEGYRTSADWYRGANPREYREIPDRIDGGRGCQWRARNHQSAMMMGLPFGRGFLETRDLRFDFKFDFGKSFRQAAETGKRLRGAWNITEV